MLCTYVSEKTFVSQNDKKVREHCLSSSIMHFLKARKTGYTIEETYARFDSASKEEIDAQIVNLLDRKFIHRVEDYHYSA